ncbi:MAG: YceI family protein [Proteobacteria bacterium]|nr:YceI family protein [Pseudomonadota bacterium]
MNLRTMIPSLAAAPLLLLAVGCVDEVGAGKTAAVVAEPTTALASAAAETRELPIDVAQSRIHALGAKITATHDIEFDRYDGSLEFANGTLVGLSVTVNMDSLRADREKLTGHLQSPDFFDVQQFPTASFVSTSVEAKAGANGATHQVTGTLTMHGVSKTIAFPAKVSEGTRTHAEFVIDRQDFGIAYPGRPDDLIQDNVVLTIDLVDSSAASSS